MTSPPGPPPGYYSDPGGTGLQRWWTGAAWTDHVMQPPPPYAFQPQTVGRPTSIAPATAGSERRHAAFGSGFASAQSVVPAGGSGPGINRGLVVALVVGALLLVSVGAYGLSKRSTTTTAGSANSGTSAVPGRAPTTPEIGGPSRVTPALAKTVLAQYWPVHEAAYFARDLATLRRLDTGAMAVYEIGAVACCGSIDAPREIVDTRFYVPRQPKYPVHFTVAVQTGNTETGAAQLLIFNKAAVGKPWLVSEDSGFAPATGQHANLGIPTVDSDGYSLGPTPEQHARATQVAAQLAALWQQTKDDSRVPSQSLFQMGEQTTQRLGVIAAAGQDKFQRNGLLGHYQWYVDPSDPLVEFSQGGADVACQVIRETVRYSYPGGTVLQDKARRNWGSLLAPGQYLSLTSVSAWQTCFEIGAPGEPILILNQNVGGSVPHPGRKVT